jgi:hypothetical protein
MMTETGLIVAVVGLISTVLGWTIARVNGIDKKSREHDVCIARIDERLKNIETTVKKIYERLIQGGNGNERI